MTRPTTAIERRRFLAAGIAAGAGAAALALPLPGRDDRQGASPERKGRHHFALSCAGYSFRSLLPGRTSDPKMSLEDFIDFCANQDLDGVELTSYFFPRTDVEYLCSLRRRAFLNGLTVTGTPVGNDFCLPPGEKRDAQLQHVRDWVDRAAILGAPCIRVFGGQTPSGHSEEEARTRCIEGLREACAYAGTKGIVLALENHGGITATAEQVLGLIRAVGSPWIGLNLDTGNFRDPDPYEAIEKAAPDAVVVQLKVELVVEGKKQPTDVARVLDILRRSGYRGVIALEYEAAEDPLEAVPRHLAELKRLVRGE